MCPGAVSGAGEFGEEVGGVVGAKLIGTKVEGAVGSVQKVRVGVEVFVVDHDAGLG